ncbi:hypothetical protein K5D34_15690 [Pseudomonas cichorii]|uniref:Uncharacterized protein n=1 Tax=Pseudomonas lijiangensis TaxID=2995658 RepID=A0ABX8HU78_9PSED|nr:MULTISPECIES: hypothetical protein [Pseudomonas syringae group]MBX8491072.1 hypothetical protein [Pseudomonas cichorii]MBX8503107.1 hypothetical protein [Pseudomonas lijiangensis]MBX8508009.1 hypothetical protein [Pseudomonas lijiangensis]MBX8511129.1 hypothetical protein [Pseudomonas cichorii]MBX8520082.1 hypothetical protein [Pseudomonas cichorii]
MALIDVVLYKPSGAVYDSMEDFEFAALNPGDHVNLPALGDTFRLTRKGVSRTDDGGSLKIRYDLFFN